MDSLRTASMTSDMETSDDLSALAWVHDELRRSLDAAHKALRRFVKDTEAMAGSDVDAVDPVVLRTARQQIHQELVRVLPGHDPFWPRWIVTAGEGAQ